MEQLTFKQIVRPLRKYWGTMIASFLIVVTTVVLLTVSGTPVYESKAVISFSEGVDAPGDLLNIPSVLRQKYLVKNQVAILNSRQLARRVVQSLNQSSYRDSLSLLGGVPAHQPSPLKETLFPWTASRDTARKYYSEQRLIERFHKRTEVVSGRDTDLIELQGRSSSPWEAAVIVNRWLEVYQDYYYNRNLFEVSKQRQFLEAELKEYRENLQESEQRLADYQRQHKIFALPSETEQLIVQMVNFESQYNETRSELYSVNSSLEYLKSQLDSTQAAFVESISHITNANLQEMQTAYATLIREKTEREAQIAGAGYDTSENEQLIQMQNRIDALYSKILMEKDELGRSNIGQIDPIEYSNDLVRRILELETSRKALIAKRDAQKSITRTYTAKMAQLPEKNREIARLQRDVQLNSNIYNLLAERYEELRISEAGEMGKIEIVDYAQPDYRPISPKTKLNIIAACFFGIVLGVTLAYSREFFNNTINGDSNLQQYGITVIARIPLGERPKPHILPPSHKNGEDIHRAKEIYRHLLLQPEINPAIEESYRTLRTAIYLKNKEKPLQSVLVTSPEPSEGKSTTAANIAISLALQNVRTLLVDADIRRPILDYLFTGSRRNAGLLNALDGEIMWADAVRETSVKKLYLLPAGHISSKGPELLGSTAMQKFLNAAVNKFRIIIFDSSPLLPVTDATIISSLVDGVIVVARNEKTPVENVRRCLDIIGQTGTPVLGTVITGVKQSELYNGYASGYYTMEESG
ncbi:polysaccharide biosynthesis tyrosine autokinase [bacterium]|nr:polysaccharide biosynthesis tyrosine autokinase [bacterium]